MRSQKEKNREGEEGTNPSITNRLDLVASFPGVLTVGDGLWQ